MDTVTKEVHNTLRVLALTNKRTDFIISKGVEKEIRRQARDMETSLEKLLDLKRDYLYEAVNADMTDEDIESWTQSLELKAGTYEEALENLQKALSTLNEMETQKAREKEMLEHHERLQRELEEEKQKEAVRAELRREFKTGTEVEKGGKLQAKLPKLTISKFNGTHLDWQRFWSQFQAEIDSTSIAQITKYSYLKELLSSGAKGLVDGLPFTAEGYERAKNILKTKYGQTSEIVNAHVQEIMALPTIATCNARKIHEFCEKLTKHVQALETMGKLKAIDGYVRMTLDRLPAIRSDLVRLDSQWKEWEFPHLVEALRQWTERNPAAEESREKQHFRKSEKSFNTIQGGPIRGCVYCDQADHKSGDCAVVATLADRRRILSTKQLCFNCTKQGHRANQCKSRSCFKCSKKHHTSICDKDTRPPAVASTAMCSLGEKSVVYPVVVVIVNGIKCRALLDTGAGSCYASSTLIEKIGVKPIRREGRRIEMLMHTTSCKVSIYNLEIAGTSHEFNIAAEVTLVEKDSLLKLKNPCYRKLIDQFKHLKGVTMDDEDEKEQLPIHMILGASEYSRIKMPAAPRVGQPGEPIAELTRFGWTIMSPGHEVDSKLYLTRSSYEDYERLCRLDVLGIKDSPQGDQGSVYEEFKEQLHRDVDGWYETGLPWKVGHPELKNNKSASLARLSILLKKLDRNKPLFDEYEKIIKNQIDEGIVERAPPSTTEKEFYIPHKAVVRESAESTKVRIVYDASARPNQESPSLNECLEVGPPLQNLMWDVIIRNRMYPIALTGDIKQAFLQIRVKAQDRDVMRFHWIKDRTTREVEVLRFTRVMFGLGSSPFLLGGTIDCHLDQYAEKYPEIVEELKKNLYVDDVVGGGVTPAAVQEYKDRIVEIFGEARFQLHKWHSNVSSLEAAEEEVDSCDHQTYAKQQLQVKKNETAILGLSWKKDEDLLTIKLPQKDFEDTKRGVLQYLASIFDPIGLVSPILLNGKVIFREICDLKLGWDTPLPKDIQKKWIRWKSLLPCYVTVPRAVPLHQETFKYVDLHVFGDASKNGCSAALYAVVFQPQGISQRLLGSSSRLSKRGLTIPRLELVAAHMSANLMENARRALAGFHINRTVAWSDSTVVLHWIRGGGQYKQFVKNRVDKIKAKSLEWHHVSTTENPADIGSRGCNANQIKEIWWKGPDWLQNYNEWPEDIETEPTADSEVEAKNIKDILATTVETRDELHNILESHSYWRTMRVTAWIMRFASNCRTNSQRSFQGPLTTEEIGDATIFWVKRTQTDHRCSERFQEDMERLNLQQDKHGIYLCRGRITGDYPVYLPYTALFSQKLVAHAHLKTLHGGVGSTMAEVRQNYWIPKLRQLVKKVRNTCYGCKRFWAISYPPPPMGNLPRDRTEGTSPFQVIGVDYAGPLIYRGSNKKDKKAYILLYSCCLTRAVYLDLLPNQTLEELVMSLKRFMARRGRPQTVYSDNFSTYVAASKWLRKIMKQEKLHDLLASHHIRWQFNLSRAPWWGGHFERLIGLVKQTLYRVMGKSTLTWKALESLLLDVELTLNNRPLGYVEDDVDSPVLTPNLMMFGKPNYQLEEDGEMVEDQDLHKQARYLKSCKDRVWKRWTQEYVKSLREQHNLKHKKREFLPAIGDIVIIRGDEKNRAYWKTGIVTELIQGRDGIVRVVRLRAGKSYLERAIQHLYPLELHCTKQTIEGGMTGQDAQPSNDGRNHARTTRRDAAAAARLRIQDTAQSEDTME